MRSHCQRWDWNQACALSVFIRIAEDAPRKDKRSSSPSCCPRQDQFKLNCTWQILIWLLLKTSNGGDSHGVRVVSLAAGWMFARSRLSCHWLSLCPVQDFTANLRNTGKSGSVGWVDVCVLVCSPGGLIDIFCVETDCDTPCCDISESSLINRVSWGSFEQFWACFY